MKDQDGRRYEYRSFYRRKLPHFHTPGGTLFVTFRLFGSIPRNVIARYKNEKAPIENEISQARSRDSGAFWEAESYDHQVRDQGEYLRIIKYVIENPVKADLVRNWRDWEWTWGSGRSTRSL